MTRTAHAPATGLGRLVDALLTTFEDCRAGLTEEAIQKGAPGVEAFVLELYERETKRLDEAIRDAQPQLSERARAQLQSEVDRLLRGVVIPAYARLAAQFTPRERNDFYIAKEGLHGVERAAGALAGILVGTLVILAPFIPLWSKEWILPFMLAGLFLPNIRRFLAYRRYERELNQLVARTDRELSRLDLAYLSSGESIEEIEQLGREPDKIDQSKETSMSPARRAKQKEES